MGGDAAEQARWTGFADPVFKTYGQDDGLPSPVATALAQDGVGFLWVGTQGGLARWDGNRFRNYKSAPGLPGTLPDNWVTALYADSHGQLWIGTAGGGLARYDRVSDGFKTYDDVISGAGSTHVSALTNDGNNGVWIATEGGLYHYNPEADRTVVFQHHDQDARSLPDNRVLALLRDRHGALWVGTRHGLATQAGDDSRFTPVPLGGGDLESASVSSLFADDDGRIWIGTTTQGAFVVERPGEVPRRLPAADRSQTAINRAGILSIAAADDGRILLGTYGEGILIVDPATKRIVRAMHRDAMPRSLGNDTVWALFRDQTGVDWAATSAGLSRLEGRDGAVLAMFGGNGDASGLSSTDVTAVLAASNGQVWLGLDSKGIDIVDPVLGRLRSLLTVSPEAGLRNLRVFALAEWPGGGVYICTDRGLYHANLDGTNVRRVTIPGRDPASRDFAALAADGRMWVGGADDGLWSFLPNNGVVAAVEHYRPNQLTDSRIILLAQGSGKDVWIGTRNGLDRLDTATGAIEHINPDPKAPTRLSAGYITSALCDAAGRLWVGTMGGGLDVLVARKIGGSQAGQPIFRRFGAAQGLPDANVDAILADAGDRVWVSTDGGIAVIDPDDFSIRTLTFADGLAFPAYWNHSAALTSRHELLFGAAGGGLTIIKPANFRARNDPPPVVITNAWLDGKLFPMGAFNNAHDRGTFVLRPGRNSLAIEFASLDYSDPQRNQYAYWLEGYDQGWIATDATRRLAGYTNLAPGDYTLHLRGSNRSGIGAEKTLDMPIHVLVAWYQTLLFKGALYVAGIGCILTVVHFRTIYLRRRQRELERLVAERTSELEESKRVSEQIARHDALTGLPNRRLYAETMSTQIGLAEQHKRQFALLLIDLDRFKAINDTLGHDVGDALLVEAGKRLQSIIRRNDLVARLGGDEFAVLIRDLPDTYDVVRNVVNLICNSIVESFAIEIVCNGALVKTSASIGVAICPEHARTQETLYKAADLALYKAKQEGRATWRWQAEPKRDRTTSP